MRWLWVSDFAQENMALARLSRDDVILGQSCFNTSSAVRRADASQNHCA